MALKGRSWARIGAHLGTVVAALFVVGLALAVLGIGPVVLVGAGGWGVWHVVGKQRLARL